MSDKTCPKCGGTDIKTGIQKGHSNIIPEKSVMKMGSQVKHYICTNCGYILESYVEKPEKFK